MKICTFLIGTVIFLLGSCTSVEHFEIHEYTDGFLQSKADYAVLLRHKFIRTEEYFYALVDNYGEHDSLIGATIEVVELNGTVTRRINVGHPDRSFTVHNDSVVVFRGDSSVAPVKTNVLTGTSITVPELPADFDLDISECSRYLYTMKRSEDSVKVFRIPLGSTEGEVAVTAFFGQSGADYTNSLEFAAIGENFFVWDDDRLLHIDEHGECIRWSSACSRRIHPVGPRRFLCFGTGEVRSYTIADSSVSFDWRADRDPGYYGRSYDAKLQYGLGIRSSPNSDTNQVVLTDLLTNSETVLGRGSIVELE